MFMHQVRHNFWFSNEQWSTYTIINDIVILSVQCTLYLMITVGTTGTKQGR